LRPFFLNEAVFSLTVDPLGDAIVGEIQNLSSNLLFPGRKGFDIKETVGVAKISRVLRDLFQRRVQSRIAGVRIRQIVDDLIAVFVRGKLTGGLDCEFERTWVVAVVEGCFRITNDHLFLTG
jgi:hypothetical protein